MKKSNEITNIVHNNVCIFTKNEGALKFSNINVFKSHYLYNNNNLFI